MKIVFIFVILIWVLPAIINAAKKSAAVKARVAAKEGQGAQRQTPSVQLHRPAPAMNRSAHRDFRAPEAPCIVCEQTGEDHFQRDKARRIAQLDDWLKIGLIDLAEYRVLRDRYERGI